MKKFITGALLVCAMLLATPAAQAAGFKFGPKVGLNVNKFSMDNSTLNKGNRCGFSAGVGAQFTVPLIGVGADVSVMYTRRNTEIKTPSVIDNATHQVVGGGVIEKTHYDYISVPVHLMYKLELPAVSRIVAPYVLTGPDFSFRVSKNLLSDIQSKKCNVGWDFGIGVELIKHLQIGATYTLGMNKAIKYVNYAHDTGFSDEEPVKGNTNGWTISAAWMF